MAIKFDAACKHLAACEPDWKILIDLIGPCTMEPIADREPFFALVNAVAHQQLNGRAAQSILNRFFALYPGKDFPSAEDILATNIETIRSCGFSYNKINTIRGIAEKRISGVVPTRHESEKMSDTELIERLTSLHGIGRWTVEMFLMHTLGRPDILPVDDFGVREGWRLIKGMDKQPAPKQLAELGKPWAPYR